MQKIQIYLRLDGVIGLPVDSYGQSAHSLASITRGMQAELVLTLLDSNGEAYDLPDYVSWDFVLAHDWDTATPPQLRVSQGIVADGNSVIIPLENINTLELIAQLGKSESVTLGAELCGFSAGVSTPDFVCQFMIIVRNRRSDAGTGLPTEVYDGQYTAAQIDALLSAKADVDDLLEIEVGAYSAGTGIDVSDGVISIDTTNATEGQVIKRTANGVAWGDVAPVIDVDDELNIDREGGVETKVLSQKGTFVDLPEVNDIDIDDELGIDRTDGSDNKYLSEKGNFVNLPDIDIDNVIGIDRDSGSDNKVLSEKGNFVNLPAGGSGGGTSYTAGDGIDISNDTIAIDTTNAVTGQLLRKTSSGVAWTDGIDVDNELSINRFSGSTSKVLSEKGTFESLPEIDVDDELGIDRSSGNTQKYLSEKGTFESIPNAIDVDNELSIDRTTGSTSKVLSEKGTFVDLPNEIDVDDEIGINRVSGSTSKVLSQKGTFVDLPSGGGDGGSVVDDGSTALLAFYFSQM